MKKSTLELWSSLKVLNRKEYLKFEHTEVATEQAGYWGCQMDRVLRAVFKLNADCGSLPLCTGGAITLSILVPE